MIIDIHAHIWGKQDIPGVLKEVEEARAKLDLRHDAEAFEKKLFLDAVEISYTAVARWFLRFAQEAEGMIPAAKEENKATLQRAADACREVAADTGFSKRDLYRALMEE